MAATEATEATQAAPGEPTAATAAVFARHLQAFASADVDALMGDYTEASVVWTPDATARGLAQIRAFFTQVFALFPAEGTVFDVTRQEVEGEVAYLAWAVTSPVVEVPLAADTFAFRDGRIAVQTFGGQILPKAP